MAIDIGNGLDRVQALSVQALGVQFDLLGNLTSREDGIAGREEAFAYDDLNRLTGTSLTDTATSILIAQTDTTYDSVGNITTKSDVGPYSYSGIGAGRSIGWSSFNKPSSRPRARRSPPSSMGQPARASSR